MTSPKFNAEREARLREQEIFDGLSPTIREALNSCAEQPPKPSTVLDALLRGVTEESILALLRRKPQ